MDTSFTPFVVLDFLWASFFSYWFYMALKVKRDEKREKSLSRLFHLTCVVLSFGLILIPALRFSALNQRYLQKNIWLEYLGVLVAFGGFSFAVWARVHLGEYWSGRITLKENHRLIQTGPYKFVRHPIYTGILTGVLGSAIAVGEWGGVLAFVILSAAYFRKIRLEEKTLTAQFGDEYRQFQRTTKAIVPFLI